MKFITLQEILLIITTVLIHQTHPAAVQLFDYNINDILKNNEVVLVNFYADWCRFSQILGPVFDEVADQINVEFPSPGKIVIAKVDSEGNKDIAEKYHVSKYPTLKLFRNGEIMKQEYRGQRSVEAIVTYIRNQLKETLFVYNSDAELEENLNKEKPSIIAHIANSQTPGYATFKKLSSVLHDDCVFYAVILNDPEVSDKVMFRSRDDERTQYEDSVDSYDSLKIWVTGKCVPLVREITFENAEELTEEGLPFLILFYHPEHKDIIPVYHKAVAEQLMSEKPNINFLTADGLRFAHPLHHLGKSADDLPILAIDSFRHMYLFPHNLNTDLDKPGLMKQFIEDLHSGKLHREFHQGPDSTTTVAPSAVDDAQAPSQHVPKIADEEQNNQAKKRTSPPESMFVKLAPSGNRYTLLRDEL